MGKQDYPHAVTIAEAFERERRGVYWGKQAMETAHQNLLVAVKDLPDTPEYSEVRRAVYRALDRMRQARKALNDAYDTSTEALLIAQRTEPIYIRNQRLLERYGGPRGENGASQVRNARSARKRREDEWADYERRQKERQRKDFLEGKDRRGEGMSEDLD